ncbi:MAG: ankyrin repeat domain-containing protein [Thalassolituus sp.]|jgi:ankyrin repeat protein
MASLISLSLALVGSIFMLSGCATSAIHEAALSGDIKDLKAFVEGGGNIEDRGDKNWVSGIYHYDGKTLLHMAAEGSQPESVRYLISKGADIEAKTSAGETPLLLSAKAGNIVMFDLLLSSGAERFATDKNGNTALLLALDSLKDKPKIALDTADALIARDADINATNRWQSTPLHLAAQHDLESVARLLIQKGANINALNNHGETPLYVSLGSPYFIISSPKYEFYLSKTFEYLVTLDQNFQVQNRRGRTLLHQACHPDYINVLFDKSVPKYEQDENGASPLFFALENCPPESVSVYFKRGFDVKSAGLDGKTVPLAALNNAYFRHEMLEFVIEQGADVTQQDSVGRSAIHQAAAHSPEILDLVIQHGGDINARTKTNATPLHVAASINISRLIRNDYQKQRDLNKETYAHLLNKAGIEVNPKDTKGCTPLHRAVNSGSHEKIQMLLEHGIDVNGREERGHTAMDMAVLMKDQRMIELFKQAGATSDIDPEEYYRVLCTFP